MSRIETASALLDFARLVRLDETPFVGAHVQREVAVVGAVVLGELLHDRVVHSGHGVHVWPPLTVVVRSGPEHGILRLLVVTLPVVRFVEPRR